MAIKKKKLLEEKAPEHLLHTCGECGWGTFYYVPENMDLNGKPICLSCQFTEERKRIRSERACDKWKAKK